MATADHLVATVDHLVVMATSLAEGVAWCEATLGVTPGPGGEHPLMGTHNRLLSLATPQFPTAYLEIIAINPVAIPSMDMGAKRWFDMDNPALRAQVAQHGPQLVHWVAGTRHITASVAALAALGFDRGTVIAASRDTTQGLLQWHITVRPDGQRLLDGTLPTLIQWGEVHPTDAMRASGVTLLGLQLQHPQAPALAAACQAIGMHSVTVGRGPARLSASLQTPKGLITLQS
jgi:hypothetical protein